jgi:hypothetical protein
MLLLCGAVSLSLLSACGSTSQPAAQQRSTATASLSPTATTTRVQPGVVSPSPTTALTPTPIPTRPAQGNAMSVALSFYTAVEAQNYALAYTYLATNATINPTGDRPQPLTKDTFIQTARTLDETVGKVTSFAAEVDSSDPAIIIMTVSRSNLAAYHSHLQFKDVSGNWRIASLDRI